MAIKKRTWYWLFAIIILALLYFVIFLYLGIMVDIQYGVLDQAPVSGEVRNTVYEYIDSFSIFVIVQFALIFYLWLKIDRK